MDFFLYVLLLLLVVLPSSLRFVVRTVDAGCLFSPWLNTRLLCVYVRSKATKKTATRMAEPFGEYKVAANLYQMTAELEKARKNNFKAFGQRDLFYSRDFCCLSPYTRIVPWRGIMSVTFSHNSNTVNKNTAFGVIGCRWCIS